MYQEKLKNSVRLLGLSLGNLNTAPEKYKAKPIPLFNVKRYGTFIIYLQGLMLQLNLYNAT